MIRELITRLNRSWSDRSISPRRRHAAPVKVWFDPELKTELAFENARAACMHGESVDLSRTGVAFLVPCIRQNEKYLVGQDRKLNIELDLPSGKVHLTAVGRRYEKVGMHISTERFLVGAHITDLQGTDKELYEGFLRRGTRRAKVAATSLQLEID